MLRITQIKLSINETMDLIPDKIIQKLHCKESDLLTYHIVKESIDASKSEQMIFSYTVDCCLKNEANIMKKKLHDVSIAPKLSYQMPANGVIGMKRRPIVIGFGPAGMFAALLLAQAGFCPIVLERGEAVEQRVKSVENFWQTGRLHASSNVQFGEGGAGTFSDGKLTARSKDPRVHKVLEEFVRFQAPEDILYQAHPHIGTDRLRNIVKRMRKEIQRLGGEFHFQACVDDIMIEQGQITGVKVQNTIYESEHVILAIGHSARDTYRMLHRKGICMHAKAFAIGARIEHPQDWVNKQQYKAYANHPRLGAAEYRLSHTAQNKRGVYTFCMCPGGTVVPSTSLEQAVVVNGMSEHARNLENANSALLVQIRTDDFHDDPLQGIAFQENLERKAFQLGQGEYRAPASLVKDFLQHRSSNILGNVRPSYALGITLCNLHDLFPSYVSEAMLEGILAFDKKMPGFARDDAILTGIETRSSSPIRLCRDEELNSLHVKGLYPCGEGAGYAGGIVSAAMDGLRCAEKIIAYYHLEA